MKLDRLKELLFGTQEVIPYQQENDNTEIKNYLDSLGEQPYMQNLLNQPKETGLTLDQYKDGFMQGLNFGVPELRDKQREFGINIPQTGEEIERAKAGEFNDPNTIGRSEFSAGLQAGPVQGGFLNDLRKGYKENYGNKFDFDNFFPTGKNIATRLGEGLGTIGRFVDSPLGRGLIAAGLNSAFGYDDSLQEGLAAMVGRQNNQTQDRIYRQSLVEDYGFAPEELAEIKGNIGKDLYNTIATNRYRQASLKVKQDIANTNDNTKRANMIMTGLNNGTFSPQEAQLLIAKYGITANDLQKSNQTRNVEINEKLLPYKQYALQVAPQVALGNLGVAQGNLGVAQGNLALNNQKLQEMKEQNDFDEWYKIQKLQQENKPDAKLTASQKDAKATLGQIQTIRGLIKNNPNATGLQKGYMPGDILNRIDSNPNNIKTRTAIDALRTKVRHDLTGAQFSPIEAKEYERFLPTNKDNVSIINAKLDALEDRYYSDFGVSLYDNAQTSGTQTIGKYKVRVK